MHKVAPEIESAINIPLRHLADATATRIRKAGLETIGLLGTRFTMEQDFYKSRLKVQGLRVLVPSERDREIVHRVIYDELCLGDIRDESRSEYLRVIDSLGVVGAQGVIEGCTEIAMPGLSLQTDTRLFDTTAIHAQQAVAAVLE